MKLEPVYAWVLGTVKQAMAKLSRSLTPIHIGTPRDNQGDRTGNASALPAGKVAWPVDPSTHDGTSIIASDCFFAEYDAKKKEVYCLDDIGGGRHVGADPLRVGVNVAIHRGEKRSGRGLVVRTAEYGTDGLAKNVFVHADADLIAHHRQPDPPDNSSMIHDPGEGLDDWAGGLHYPLRVRKWIESFCQGATTSGDEQLYAPLFNFTRNGDGTVAHGAAHFAKDEACLSHEASGPLRPSSKKHELGHSGDVSVKAGAIDVKAYFSDGTDAFTGPITFSREPWEQGKKYLYITNPQLRMDEPRPHDFNCGPRKGVFDFWDTVPLTIYDPPPRDPETPPPRQPEQPPPRDPEDDDDPPPTIIGPNREPVTPDYPNPFPSHKPSIAAPHEIETPSAYKHPRPGIPDDVGPDRARDDGTRAGQWRAAVGFDESDWMRTPIVVHEDSMPVYESATANDKADSPAGRWPTVKTEHELVMYDQDGAVLGRHPAIGPGSVIDMPANMNASHALASNNAKWPASPADFARIVFAAGLAAGATDDDVVDGRFGLGRRVATSPFVASGWEFKLVHDGTGEHTNPDLYLTAKDEEAAENANGAEFRIDAGLHVTGKLTVDGLIDPTGLEFDPVAANPGGVAANTIWVHDGTDQANGTLQWENRARIKTSLVVGDTDDPDTVTIAGVDFSTTIKADDSGSDISISVERHSNAAILAGLLDSHRSRGTHATPAAVQNGDDLLGIYASGYDGTDYALSSAIIMDVEETTPGAGAMGGRIRIQTSPAGSEAPADAITIFNDKRMRLANHLELAEVSAPATPASGYGRLYVKTDGKLYFKDDSGTETDLTAGGGSGPLVSQGTAGANTSDAITGVTTGIRFTLATGEYVITCMLGCTTAATTTAPRFSMQGTGGLVAPSLDLVADVCTSATAVQAGNANALNGWTAGTTGMGATRRPVEITCRVRVTTAGTITLWLRSEVGGSLVTMVEGSGYAIKTA